MAQALHANQWKWQQIYKIHEIVLKILEICFCEKNVMEMQLSSLIHYYAAGE